MKKPNIKIFNIKYLILILPVWLFLLISPLSFTEAITFVPITPPPGTPVPGACQSDTDCPSTEYCAPPSLGLPKANCQKKKAVGEECSENRMCLSNVCETGQGGKKYCINPVTGEGKVKWQPIAPKLQINIPTWTPFTSEDIEKLKQTDEEGNVYIPFIGLYIAAIYRWAVGIAALVAVVFVIAGGFLYLTAGGNAQRAQEGKDRISHALFGLLLLLGSYALLYTINPDLVRFKSLKVKVIERIEADVIPNLEEDLSSTDITNIASFPATCTTPGIGTNNIPLFKQGKCKDVPFGVCGYVPSNGCGPTSLAMVLKYYGHDANPASIAKEWADRGYRGCKGTSYPPDDKKCADCSPMGHGEKGLFTDEEFLKKYNIKTTYLGTNTNKIIDALKAGKLVIASVSGPSIFTGAAHFIVLTGVSPEGTLFSINDSNASAYCADGTSPPKKCPAGQQTIQPNAVPVNLVIKSLKVATSFESAK